MSGHIIFNMFLPLMCIFIYLVLALLHLLNYKFNKDFSTRISFVNYLLVKSRKYSKEVIEGFHEFMTRTFIELSLDISVCSLIELLMRQTLQMTEIISYTISVILSLSLVLLTISFYILIKNNPIKISEPKIYERFNQKYAVMWDGLKVGPNKSPIFNILFIIRRIAIGWVIVYLLLYP